MKILSWNVNGLNACLKKGFLAKIKEHRPDFICLQETKLNEEIPLAIPYNKYWHCSTKKGYSGTAVFSRYNPVSVSYGIGVEEIDIEGRVITLEFKHFYLVNVYVPNSQANLKRFDYRAKFDIAFKDYISSLQENKPVVLCGDFNVAHTDIDIYPENEINDKLSSGFQTQERSNFSSLLELGLADVFRYSNPDKIEYSWWSNRLNKRFKNKGWRIDYFLISQQLTKYIIHFKHLTDIYGSDHCPLLLDINHQLIHIDTFTDEELTARWNAIDWVKAEDVLLDMQQKLTKAAFTENHERIIVLQKRIVRSEYAKVLAVRHVCETSSSPGIDNIKWTTPAEKMKAALSLSSVDYKAQPCRHIVIHSKNNGKERRISLPTMYDRAMQVLYAYSLDPIAEANGERKSFAFRKGRSMQDVHSYILHALSGIGAPRYVLIGDVKACYNSISHKWLLDNIPMDKHVLREFLKSGFVFAGEIFPTEQGISLGANISPILGNMTLDGLQKYIFEAFYGNTLPDYRNGNLIRFADDILVTAYSKEQAESFKTIINDFLYPRGLKLSETKTAIYDVYEGFNFLSRNYSNKNTILYSTPSKNAVERFKQNLRETIDTHKGSQKALIETLNKKLIGFATYHRVSEAYDAFVHIDVAVNAYLLNLCMRKHPKQSQAKIIEKYWYKRGDGESVYAVKDKIECQVIRLSDVLLVSHNKIKTKANPYLEIGYFEKREEEKQIFNVIGKYKAIWQRQNGICYYCKKPILADQQRTVIPLDVSHKTLSAKNLAYIHTACKENDMENHLISKDDPVLYSSDLMSLLYKLKDGETPEKERKPFERLSEYFLNLEDSPHTLAFEKIERIMETPLCNSAYKHSGYWHNKNLGSIAHCWLKNGYIIQHLHLDKKYIVFRKENTNVSKLIIPSVFLTKKIPLNAKYEIENYLEFIQKKYGL